MENYNNFENMGFIKFEELVGILNRHINDGNDPYTEDQVFKIIKWIEETSINGLLLNMVIDGEIDIIFDEKLKTDKKMGENDLLFTLTKKKLLEMKSLGIDFGEDKKETPSIFKNLNLFSGSTDNY